MEIGSSSASSAPLPTTGSGQDDCRDALRRPRETPPPILIYNDWGTGKYVTEHTREFVHDLVRSLNWGIGATNFAGLSEVGAAETRGPIARPYIFTSTDFGFIDASRVREGTWRQTTKLLIMPGGFDRGYCSTLNGAGNAHIRSFVAEQGGKYLGFCAGAFFGSAACEFDMWNFAGKDCEIVESRELAFYAASARGPFLGPYDSTGHGMSLAASVVLEPELQWEEQEHEQGQDERSQKRSTVQVFYDGGCAFVRMQDGSYPAGTTVLAHYDEASSSEAAAIVEVRVGSGRAILSGVHPEITTDFLRQIAPKQEEKTREHLDTGVIPALEDQRYRLLLRALFDRLVTDEMQKEILSSCM